MAYGRPSSVYRKRRSLYGKRRQRLIINRSPVKMGLFFRGDGNCRRRWTRRWCRTTQGGCQSPDSIIVVVTNNVCCGSNQLEETRQAARQVHSSLGAVSPFLRSADYSNRVNAPINGCLLVKGLTFTSDITIISRTVSCIRRHDIWACLDLCNAISVHFVCR